MLGPSLRFLPSRQTLGLGLLALGLASCIYYDPTEGPGTDPQGACGAPGGTALLDRSPAANAADVSPLATISGVLTVFPKNLEISVVDSSGSVAGDLQTFESDRSFFFAPTQALAAGPVSVTLIADDCGFAWAFQVGLGLPPASDLVGRHWRLDPAQAREIQPAVFGALIANAADTQATILIELSSASPQGDLLQGIAAWETGRRVGLAGQQDMCLEAVDLPDIAYAGPSFSAGPVDWTFFTYSVNFAIDSLTFQGHLSQDGATVTEATLMGNLDLRPMEPSMGLSWQVVCDLLQAANEAPCVPCVSDSVAACAPVVLEGLIAPEVLVADPLDPAAGPNHQACTQ